VSRDASRGAAEDRIAALLRTGVVEEGLGPAARARVWSRLHRPARRWRPLTGVRWIVAAVVLLASVGVFAGATARLWWPAVPSAAPAPAAPRSKTRSPRHRRAGGSGLEEAPLDGEARADPAPPAPVAGAPAAMPAEIQAAAARPKSEPAGVARAPRGTREVAMASPSDPIEPAPASPAAPSVVARAPRAAAGGAASSRAAVAAPTVQPAASALALETPLLADALARLRQHRDAAGALAALEVYDARFPRGTLRGEADRTRVDALLMLGRDGDALEVLGRLTLRSQGRDQELRVIRGELAAATSCERAVADFNAVLAAAPAPALAERALHGRASCLARTGDASGAARDLREYLRRFPEGRFAAEARTALGQKDL
jgi:hypothetical protein